MWMSCKKKELNIRNSLEIEPQGCKIQYFVFLGFLCKYCGKERGLDVSCGKIGYNLHEKNVERNFLN